jgi:soluble lytic murein transglycosylase-like protein
MAAAVAGWGLRTVNWKDGGEPYLNTLNAAEQRYAIPTDLLARIAYQECSWRPGVIDGSIKSPAGAVGMMQLMPQFFPGAGESWQADVTTAAEYLERLHTQFNDWQLAVAAYNWGPGNVVRYKADPAMGLPPETSDYVLDVFGDVPIAGAILNA